MVLGTSADGLGDGELILWEGGPDPHAGSVGRAVVAIVFVPWALACLAATVFALASGGAPALALIVGLPLFAVGAYMAGVRLVIVRRNRARTRYMVTNWRAAVIVGGRTVRATGWQETSVLVHRHKHHISVAFHGPTDFWYPWGRWGRRFHGDIGMDMFGLSLIPGVHFYDVANGDGLLAALAHPPRGVRPVHR
jgi:hypothetical protein